MYKVGDKVKITTKSLCVYLISPNNPQYYLAYIENKEGRVGGQLSSPTKFSARLYKVFIDDKCFYLFDYCFEKINDITEDEKFLELFE